MIALNKNEKAFYKRMLSNTSKLGCKSISLNAEKISNITTSNLKYKNLISELGIFLLEK